MRDKEALQIAEVLHIFRDIRNVVFPAHDQMLVLHVRVQCVKYIRHIITVVALQRVSTTRMPVHHFADVESMVINEDDNHFNFNTNMV